MTGYVYKLICADTNSPLYVGSTIQDPKKRMIGHLSFVKSSKFKLYRHIRENKIKLEMVILETVYYTHVSELRTAENKWMNSLKKEFIFNRVPANDGVISLSKHFPMRTSSPLLETLQIEAKASNESVNTVINDILLKWAKKHPEYQKKLTKIK